MASSAYGCVMSTPDLKSILDALAAGDIDAAEAARRIEAAKSGQAVVETPAEPAVEAEIVEDNAFYRADEQWLAEPAPRHAEPEPPRGQKGWQSYAGSAPQHLDDDGVPQAQRRAPREAKGVERLVVQAVGRRVRIVGDYSVATVAAEGPHVLRRRGDTLEITSDGEIGPSLDGFSMLRPPRSFDDLRSMSFGKELYLRVNPGIVVDVEVTAGSLSCDKVPYLGKVRVTAGSATLGGVAECNDVLVQAGSATIAGALRTGRSRVRVESGSLALTLAPESNVTVHAEAQLGRIKWVDQVNVDEQIIGNGSAKLDVSVVMGSASIEVGASA